MKILIFVLTSAALVLNITGHPVEQKNENNTSAQGRTLHLSSIAKKITAHTKRLFDFGENLATSSRRAAVGLSTLVRSGDVEGSLLCTGCQTAVKTLRLRLNDDNENEIYSMIENTCTLLHIQSRDVCSGIAHLFGPEFIPILKSNLDALHVCSFLLTKDCVNVKLPEWNVTLPPKGVVQEQYLEGPAVEFPILKVLHLTDTHYDRFYTEGAKTNCREPLCCRAQSGIASGGEKGAGKWGDYECDIPERTLDSMLEHAANTHPDIDFIYWTGDLPAHDIWNQSRDTNLEMLRLTAEKVKHYFPHASVLPAIGNHESAPTDIYPFEPVAKTPSWLYKEIDKQWGYWLPHSTTDTILRGAFYTLQIRRGLRVVSLNTNYCHHRNWWLMLDSVDPVGQLKWLVEVLRKSEEINEKVHIIGHIPPGQSDCLPSWRDNYYRIAARFNDTIAGHFFGHTHKDEFEIYYDTNNKSKPVGVGYIAPSVTTFTSLNPGYRIYYTDGDRFESTRTVLDYENWVMDLKQSNTKHEPVWYKSYTAKEEFNMTSLTPEDWDHFYKRLKTDDQLLQLYYKRSNKDFPESSGKPCDGKCKKAILCNIRSCNKYN